jgi:tol-pal system protein YbgF
MVRPAKLFSPACRIAVLVAALGAGQAQAGLFDDDEARRQLMEFRAATESQFDTQAKAQLDLAGQIQRQTDEIAKLQGLIETLTYELETAKKRQQDFYIDLDTRVRKLESAAAAAPAETPAPAAGTAEAPKAAAAAPAANPAAETQEYESALGFFKSGKYKEAATAFGAFLQKHPESSLAPNAQFWLGNAWYAQRDCKKAIEAQNQVTAKWPESPKAPDAMLAVATCQQELGNGVAAKRSLEALVARYPSSPAAESASQRLKKK